MTFPKTVTLLNVKNGSSGRGRHNYPKIGDKTNTQKGSDYVLLLNKL